VVHEPDGKVYTVRYDAVNAMLLNEFLKEHQRVEKQQATIGQLRSNAAKQEATISELKKAVQVLTAQIKDQSAQIQKVSAQIEMNKPGPQTVANR
jgi:septal ring factor EnvC (AmiA/AmiB activator)